MIFRDSKDANRAGGMVCGDGENVVTPLSGRTQPLRPILGMPPRLRQPNRRSLAASTAVLLDVLQHEQLSPVQVRHHRNIRPDTLRGIMQWRQVMQVKHQWVERTEPC